MQGFNQFLYSSFSSQPVWKCVWLVEMFIDLDSRVEDWNMLNESQKCQIWQPCRNQSIDLL